MMSEAQNVVSEWGNTLRLPKTDFAMRANLPAREPAWVQRWLEMDVYGKLREKREAEGAKKFIVHLGPPYANGHMHMGHALTYVLKDFVVRSKFMGGMDSPYVPGWDCHGLPIEWKVEQDELRAKGKTKHDVSKEQLRAWCRAYAEKWVAVQKSEWQRFGALGDWDNPYLTMAAPNEAGIVRELGKMVRRGLVYRGLRSTQWSWAEETALAEAEVEYKDVTSTAVYVALPVVGRDDEFLVIWTTTPWTLPANRAVAVKVDEDYEAVELVPAMGVVKNGDDATANLPWGSTYWVAKSLKDAFLEKLGAAGVVHETLHGEALVGWEYKHPLYDTVQKVYPGFHVTTDAGTGLVHIAPAHGQEDFLIGKEFGLDLNCPVDGAGKYESNVAALPKTGEAIAGKLIWPMQKMILAELEATGRLLAKNEFQHSYPVSWRSKEKLIFRSTEQWFVSMDKKIEALGGQSLRDASLDRIFARNGVKGVNWVPQYGANRIGGMIEGRPDWCISRQRAWGVPITIIQNKATGELVGDEAVWDHIAALVEKENIDAWDTRLGGREAELFPDGWLAKHNAKVDDFAFARDILDVWFDSGTTHAHVLRKDAQKPGQRFYREDGKRPADLYQEGSDQHRGWFHSSLLTSVANYGDAPYESVVTSGFVVDGEGRKFSKSLGNGVEPRQLLEKYGMDIIRLWVASSDYSEDIRYSPQIIDNMADAYRRFRNTFRWLLGNLNGVADVEVDVASLPELERYMLHRLSVVLAEVRAHYDAYQFHKGYRALYEFCGTELSNFYFDVRKDVLYCDAEDSPTRRACVSVLVQMFKGLVTHLAPLMPFTTDEAWRERYGQDACVHFETYTRVPTVVVDEARWSFILVQRDFVNIGIEDIRKAGGLGANLEVDVRMSADLKESPIHEGDEDLLREVFGVAEVKLEHEHAEDGTSFQPVKSIEHGKHKCPRCWRYYGKLEESGICFRCDEAVQQVKAA